MNAVLAHARLLLDVPQPMTRTNAVSTTRVKEASVERSIYV